MGIRDSTHQQSLLHAIQELYTGTSEVVCPKVHDISSLVLFQEVSHLWCFSQFYRHCVNFLDNLYITACLYYMYLFVNVLHG